jgi:hypothetical protein
VFSPSILCGGLRSDGRKVGISLPIDVEAGVGVAERLLPFSGDFVSGVQSLLIYGDVGRCTVFSGDLDGEADRDPPSMKLLRSLTLPVCIDCMRL